MQNILAQFVRCARWRAYFSKKRFQTLKKGLTGFAEKIIKLGTERENNAEGQDMKKTISKSMLEKVCNGRRNFGFNVAKQVSRFTRTEVSLWQDPDKASQRKKWQKAIELSGLVKEG